MTEAAAISAGAAALGLALLAAVGCGVEGDGPGGPAMVGPALLLADPPDGASGVSPWVSPRLIFDRYLDPLPLREAGILALGSGERTVRASQRYDPVTRSLELLPDRPLQPHLVYRLRLLRPEALLDTDGRPLQPVAGPPPPAVDAGPPDAEPPPPQWAFLTGPLEDPPPAGASPDELREGARALMVAQCFGCHGPSTRAAELDLSDPAVLVGRTALTRAGRQLVVPGRPADSYLLHKTLPLYPDRGGDPMPPSGPALGPTQLGLLRDALRAAVWW